MAATPAKVARTADSAFVPGGTAHIYAPPIGTWPILVDRAAYDEYYRAFEAGDKGGVTEVLSRSEWIAVADRDAVLIIDVDGDAVQVELLDGRSAGGRGWLQMRHLHP